jgi:hypothetical protein
MFLDSENLRPVIITMAVYLAIAVLVPRLAKKPTGIRAVDDVVMALIAQKHQLMSNLIVIGVSVLAAGYVQDQMAA